MEIAYFAGLIICALGYLATSGLLFSSRATGPVKIFFLLVSIVMIVWSLGYGVLGFLSNRTLLLSPLLESLQLGTWLLLLLAILDNQNNQISKYLRSKFVIAILVLVATFNIAIFSPFLSPEIELRLLIIVSLMGAIVQLILLEQIYRSSGKDKWAFKPLVLGMAMVNIFHLIMMSNALLLNTIDINFLAARPYIFFILTPLLLLSMKRVKNWDLKVFISRDVVLNSALLLFSGGYLLVMAMTGYFIQQIGATWSGMLQIVFVAGALVSLAYIFISDSLRKHFKTYIQKHFYANQFDYREEWLALTHTLDVGNEDQDVYETSLKGVCGSLHYNNGAYIKLASEHLELKTPDVFKLSHKALMELHILIERVERNHWILDLPEFHKEEYQQHFGDCRANELLACGVEILLPLFVNQQLHGMFLLSSKNADRIKVNWEIRDYLSAVSSQVSSFIRSGEARETLEENAKFAAFNRMSAFVVHDLKNVVAQIGLIVDNAKKFRDNPEFIDDTFETLEHTKQRMDKMLSQLKEKQQHRSVSATVELNALMHDIIEQYHSGQPAPEYVATSESIDMNIDQDRFSSVIGHLIDNAQQATDEKGSVLIKAIVDDADSRNAKLKVIISDTGIGMSQDFIDNLLFKPFETTKGNAGMGVGVYEAKSFAQEYNGSLTVDSELGVGTTFVMTLPLSQFTTEK